MTLHVSTGYPDAWHRIADLPLLAQRRWHLALRGRLDGQPHWFWQTAGGSAEPATVVAGLAGFVVRAAEAYPYGNLHALLLHPDGPLAGEDVRRTLRDRPVPGAAVLPNLVLTYPGYASFAVGSRALDQPALRTLLAAVIGWAGERGLAAVALPYAEAAGPLAAAARDLGFAAAPLTSDAWLDVSAGGFPRYLARFGGHRRRRIEAERRRVRAAGLRTRLEHHFDAELLAQLGRLRALQRGRYALASDAAAEAERLTQLVHLLGPAATATIVSAPGEPPLSFALQARDGAVWHEVCCGTDHADPRSRFAYFEATFYAPIEFAAAAGVRQISFGIAAEEAKLRRGAHLVPLTALMLGLTEPARAATEAMRAAWAATETMRAAWAATQRIAGAAVP